MVFGVAYCCCRGGVDGRDPPGSPPGTLSPAPGGVPWGTANGSGWPGWHMCGLLFMCLKAIDPLSEVYAAVQHAAQVAQVAQDTMTIQWPTVRAWLQACFSHVENSGASWHDSALFKEERFRLSWCKGKSQPDIMILCPGYNDQALSVQS